MFFSALYLFHPILFYSFFYTLFCFLPLYFVISLIVFFSNLLCNSCGSLLVSLKVFSPAHKSCWLSRLLIYVSDFFFPFFYFSSPWNLKNTFLSVLHVLFCVLFCSSYLVFFSILFSFYFSFSITLFCLRLPYVLLLFNLLSFYYLSSFRVLSNTYFPSTLL